MPMRLFQQSMIAAGLALATPAAGAQAFEVSLQPSTVEVPAEAGDRTRQAFTITNDNGDDIHMGWSAGAGPYPGHHDYDCHGAGAGGPAPGPLQ